MIGQDRFCELLWQTGKASPQIVQSPRQQRQRITVAELGSRAQAPVERTSDDPVMVEQPQRLVRDDLLELIFARCG